MVTSTWRAPAWTAASVLAVASPRSLWQWTLTVACAPTRSTTFPTRTPELGRDGVADGVGDVDGRRAGLDDRLVDLQQEVEVGPRGVLGGELDLGVAPELLAPVADPADGFGERRLAVDPELVLEVDVAGRDEHVEVRPLGDLDRLDRPLRVAVLAARERRDGDPAAGLLGDPPDRLEVAGRGGREAGLDDVDLEPRQLAGDLELLGRGQAGAGRLLAVAQGGVEDADRSCRHERPDRAGDGPRSGAYAIIRGAHLAAPGVVAAAWAWPASTSTGLRNGIWARSRAPTCSIWWSRSAARSRSNSARPDSLSAIQRAANVPSWMSRRTASHRRPDVVVDDPRPGHVVAVLGGVADAEAHEVEAAAVHQVDDELELVHRLEVGELGLVAGLDERLEGHLDQRRRAAAQDGLLAEQVGLGLLGEGRLEDAGAGGAERPGVGEHARAPGARRVLLDGEQGRHAAAGLVDRAEQVARALGRDHPDVDDVGRGDPPEVDVEAVGEHQQLAGAQVRRDLGVVDGLLGGVRDEDHDHVGRLDRVGDVHDPQAGLLGEGAALGARREPDDDVDAGLVEVQRVGVALAAVADDRDRLPGQRRRIGVVVVVHARCHRLMASSIDPEPRAITTAPVRTNSLMP